MINYKSYLFLSNLFWEDVIFDNARWKDETFRVCRFVAFDSSSIKDKKINIIINIIISRYYHPPL